MKTPVAWGPGACRVVDCQIPKLASLHQSISRRHCRSKTPSCLSIRQRSRQLLRNSGLTIGPAGPTSGWADLGRTTELQPSQRKREVSNFPQLRRLRHPRSLSNTPALKLCGLWRTPKPVLVEWPSTGCLPGFPRSTGVTTRPTEVLGLLGSASTVNGGTH